MVNLDSLANGLNDIEAFLKGEYGLLTCDTDEKICAGLQVRQNALVQLLDTMNLDNQNDTFLFTYWLSKLLDYEALEMDARSPERDEGQSFFKHYKEWFVFYEYIELFETCPSPELLGEMCVQILDAIQNHDYPSTKYMKYIDMLR